MSDKEDRNNCEGTESKDNSMLSLNESQDFQLIDTEESDKLQVDVVNAQEKETKDAALKSSVADTHTVEHKIEENIDGDKSKDVEKNNAVTTEVVESTNDEDEVIQGTPPRTYVSPKKHVVSSETTSLKRKASSFDEPASKFMRTSSREDALSFDKRKGEVDDTCESMNFDDSNVEANKKTSSTVIIAETQDVEDDEQTLQTVDNSADDILATKDAKISSDKNDSVSEEKDKGLNNSSQVAEVINVSDSISQENSLTAKTIDQVKDNNTVSVMVKEKDITHCPTSSSEKVNSTNDLKSDQCEQQLKATPTTEKKSTDHFSTNDKQSTPESLHSNDNDVRMKDLAVEEISSRKDSHPKSATSNSRMSVEVIYDRGSVIQNKKSRPTELVEIDENGDKIVLDSSQEESQSISVNKSIFDSTNTDTVYKSCYESKSSSEFSYKSIGNTKESLDDSKLDSRLTNGSSESKKCDTDGTVSVESDIFANDIPSTVISGDDNVSIPVHNVTKEIKVAVQTPKEVDNTEVLTISDHEPDASVIEENVRTKSDLIQTSSLAKATQVEKEIGIFVRLKCLLHLDESTKEFLSKELTAVHCEPTVEPSSIRQKSDDTSASLADISGNDNKDASPGSVNSNPQLFHLNPSRLSFISTVSSSSSVSSAASLAAKLAIKDSIHFPFPKGPAKHAKKISHDVVSSIDKQSVDEAFERLTKEWNNSRLLTTTILSFANAELSSADTCNVSNERLDDQLQKMRSSTPELEGTTIPQTTTPKSTRKGRTTKRPRSKSNKSNIQSNGLNKDATNTLASARESNNTPNSKKKVKTEKVEPVTPTSNSELLPKPSSQNSVIDELVGKTVFAKWSDNNYYPGTVTDKVKAKYKVHFYDGKNKLLIEDFVIPIPKTLNEGLSVYATTKNDDYGSCGIITDVKMINDEVHYIVETDDRAKLDVQVQDIFLSADQAQVLKEESTSDTKSLPSTPKHLSQITLDNMVEGKRRSKRIGTPLFSTPKSRIGTRNSASKGSNAANEPSVSGVAVKDKKAALYSDNEGKSSDSSVSVQDDTLLSGIQPEIIGTPNEQIVKGPQHRIKGKPRSKKKSENEETIATLGPIPLANSTLFKGMSFILTCVSLDMIDRYRADSKGPNKGTDSDTGTENEEEWVQRPFVRDRLRKQIVAGGGKLYEHFGPIPQEEYKTTKLITNVPNTTEKSLLCLSVGIPAYNHKWIIRCCQQDKIVNPAEDELPAGWSLGKKSYVEMFQRPSKKPLTETVVIIPTNIFDAHVSSFWRQVCENAGAVVLIAESAECMEGFVAGAVVLANRRCPSWAIEKANNLKLPVLSTTWVVQCLVEGKLCPYEFEDRFLYNYTSK